MKKSKFLSELSKGELFSIYPDVTNAKQIYVAIGDVYTRGNSKSRVCCAYLGTQNAIVEDRLVYPLGLMQI